MRVRVLLVLAMSISMSLLAVGQARPEIPNPSIDMKGFLKVAGEAAAHRETRRLTVDEFMRMAAEPGTVLLDARSKEKFDEMHVRGAVNLSFPDITVESLDRLFPDKRTRILIYCNNNFENEEIAFPRKIAVASLNISTYISLYSYGYRNVYELGPLLDVKTTKLALVSSAEDAKPSRNNERVAGNDL